MKALQTLVVIPAFNEEECLPDVLRGLAEECPDLDVLVVDDGSKDGTADVARAAGVAVAVLPYNLGIGGALRTGFRYAVRRGYERAVQFDADGQHDPGEVRLLLDALDDGADMVVGTRFAGGRDADYQVGFVRKRAMRLLHVGVRMLSGREFSDTSSGFRAFSRPMLELFARQYPVDYMDSVEALLVACNAGMRVVEVPVRMRSRAAGTPSTRNVKLVYHYLRLLVVMAASATRRGRRPSEAPR